MRQDSTADLKNRHGDTPAESATTGKALVRAVAQGRGEGSPAGYGSAQESDTSIRRFRGTSKGREETAGVSLKINAR